MMAAPGCTASAARQNGAHRRGIHLAARCDDHEAAAGSRGSGRCESDNRGSRWMA